MNQIYTLIIGSLICAGHLQLKAQAVSFSYNGTLLNPVSGFTAYADCAVDMNGDQLDDVVRVGAKGLFIDYQQPDGSFSQKFFPVIIQSPPEWSVCAGDLDNNGFNDLLFANTENVSFLKANQSGTSYSETVMPGFLICQRSTMADINNDGWLDAFVCNDTSMSVPYRNDGTGNMSPDTNFLPSTNHPGSYAAIWTDYDNDGDIDLYISKCKGGAAPGNIVRTNLLYRNNSDGSFSEVATSAGLDDNSQSWCTVFEDFDNDGDMDAFVINHDFQNMLFRNNGNGQFTDVVGASGIDPFDLVAEESVSGDFNNDGFIDIFSELSQELYLGNGDLTFIGQDAPTPPGAIADLNNDGFLDVLKNGQIWFNNGNNETHWLKVLPFGLVGNRNGIGARVEIYGAWGTQIREVRSGEGYSPSNSLTVHFGLGNNEIVDSLKITWPSGIKTVLKNLHADTTYLVPEAECLLPAVLLGIDKMEHCPGDTIQLEAPAGFAQYFWSNGATEQSSSIWEDGKYFAVLTDDQACIALTNSVEIITTKDIPPTISAAPARRLCQGDSIVLTASPGQNHLWSNGLSGDHIAVTASGNYTVSVDAKCSAGQLDSPPFEVAFLPAPPPMVLDVSIGQGDSIILSAVGQNCHWFDQSSGGNLLKVGSDFQTPPLAGNTAYFVESHPFYPGAIQMGGKPDTSGLGGLSSQTGFMLFEAWEPFTLHSVRVFLPAGTPEGSRFIQMFSQDTLLAFKQFQITTGWNELELDFDVPVGKFSLHCPLGNLFRNIDPTSYPYPIGDVGQITNTSFGQGYYFYFYDWRIKTQDLECISERVPVFVTVSGTTEHQLQNKFEIFPNPTAGTLTIRMDDTPESGGQLRIFDASGRLVQEQKLPEAAAFTLDTGGLASGVYWLQIQLGTQMTNKKFTLF